MVARGSCDCGCGMSETVLESLAVAVVFVLIG